MTTKKNPKHDPNLMLLHSNLKQLRLPTMKAEFEKLAREASAANQTYEQYLLQLTELEVTARASNALTMRIRNAHFPVEKDLESYDFSAIPSVSKQKILELARCEWIRDHGNVCLLGQPGTGKTHLAIALGLAACREGIKTRFFTAASLVNQLEEAQKQVSLDRLLKRLDKLDLLIVDELGYLSFSRSGADLVVPEELGFWGFGPNFVHWLFSDADQAGSLRSANRIRTLHKVRI